MKRPRKTARTRAEKVRIRQRFLDEKQILLSDAREEKAFEVAIAMKRKGYPVAEIAELTGLLESEIERLR